MKAKEHIKTMVVLFGVLFFLACQQDETFEIPTEIGTEENAQLNVLLSEIKNDSLSLISISQVKGYFVNRNVHTITSNLVVKGYVVSSDRTGNFYKELYLQDDPITPTAALHIMVDQVDSYNMFNPGREVYIDLNGLHIGEARRGNGIISLGGSISVDGNEVEPVRQLDIQSHFYRTKTTAEIVPLPIRFSEITSNHIGMFVSVEDVSITASEQGKPFVAPRDYFDTQRTLEGCEGGSTVSFILETSAFASYKDLPLPSGTGTINGIVSKTYNGSDIVLTLNDAVDAALTGPACGG